MFLCELSELKLDLCPALFGREPVVNGLEVLNEFVSGLVTLLWVLLHHLSDDGSDLSGHLRVEISDIGNRFVDVLFEDFLNGDAAEGSVASKHLEE